MTKTTLSRSGLRLAGLALFSLGLGGLSACGPGAGAPAPVAVASPNAPATSNTTGAGGAGATNAATGTTNGTKPADIVSRCSQVGAQFDIYASTAPVAGKAAGLALGSCGGSIAAPVWTQTGGPVVNLLSHRTQAIAFDPPQPGAYTFSVSFTDSAGASRSETKTLNVGAPPAVHKISVRNSHAVRMGGNVSVRAWPQLSTGELVRSISWSQLEGPAVTLDTSDNHRALFTAPLVARDTVIRLRAAITTSSGVTDSHDVMVLVERYTQADSSNANAVWDGMHVSRVYPYQASGPWAAVLTRCVYDANMQVAGANASLCPLSTLPILAQETGGDLPTVEQVMARVLVSHDWLGKNFEAFLRSHDTRGDFRRMMNSVTAVVLGAQVRPSFYFTLSGAIYLDADNFWLDAAERDTINEAADYRSDFASDLSFSTPWRYVQNGRSVFTYFDPRARITRTIDDVRNEAAPLLYHELAHALDFLPPAQYAALDNQRSPWDNVSPRYAAGQLASDLVSAQFPLTSSELRLLGNVMFRGSTATALQRSYTPDQVANFFIADLATDPYAYSNSREDAAITLEEFLMSHRLGIARDFAIADKITSTTTGASLMVRWGQRGRVGETAIKPRVASLVSQLTPWIPATEVDTLPAPLAMRAGDSWHGNLALPSPLQSIAVKSEPGFGATIDFAQQMKAQAWLMNKEAERMRHHMHDGRPGLPHSSRIKHLELRPNRFETAK